MTDHIAYNDGNWFLDLLMKLAPDADKTYKDATPEEMIRGASWKAFEISTGLGLIPGPVGMAVVLPEIITITKLQINLVCRIATHYEKRDTVNHTIILLIFGNALGVYAGKEVVEKIGSRLVVKTFTSQTMRMLAQKMGTKIGVMAVQRGVGRYIPFVLAPVFGAFSKSMTKKIGREAIRLFSREIEVTN